MGRWFGVDAYTHSMPWMSPYNAMANNPGMFVDPDGNDPITFLVLGTAALVGGGLNLWSNADKVRDFKSGLAYFASGAGRGLNFLSKYRDRRCDGQYAGFTILDGLSAGQAGNLSRGLIGFAESGKFA